MIREAQHCVGTQKCRERLLAIFQRDAAQVVIEPIESRSDAISIKATEAAVIDLTVWLKLLFFMAFFVTWLAAALPPDGQNTLIFLRSVRSEMFIEPLRKLINKGPLGAQR